MGTVFFLLTSKKNYKITNNSFLVSPVVQCQSKSNAFAQLTILSSKNVLKTFVLVMGTFYMSSFHQAFCVSSGRPRSQAPLLADWRNSNPAPIS